MKFKAMIPLLALITASGYAQSKNISKKKIKRVKKAKKVDVADEIITNKKLRASEGSLSSLSIKTSFTYNGGSISKPFDAERPNIASAGDVTSLASMSGNISGSYRLNKQNRIGLGTGLSMIAPFNSSIETEDENTKQEFKDNQGRLDVSDPYISYSFITRLSGVQTILTASATEITESAMKDRGYQRYGVLSANTMYNFGGSRFSLGAVLYGMKYQHYEGTSERAIDTVAGFLPQAEYDINDTYNLRTIVHTNKYRSTKEDPNDFKQSTITQSIGLGISLNRDLYLYPNIQFVHKNLQADVTNIALSAYINAF